MNFDPTHLATLAAILRFGSFEAAADALNVTPSAISQRLKGLEEKTGLALVVRGTPCTGTEAGNRLARHADELAVIEANLARDIGLPGKDTPIRIAVNADSLATWVLPALAETSGLLFDLVVDDQTRSADWLKRGEVSAAITDHTRAVQGCDAFPLGALRYIATASPEFMTQHFNDGLTSKALAVAPVMRFNEKDSLQHDWVKLVSGSALHPPCHHLPSSLGFVEAARLGLGWGMNPEPLVSRAISRGRLVALKPDAPMDVHLVWQVNRMMAPHLKELTRAIRTAAAKVLVPQPREG